MASKDPGKSKAWSAAREAQRAEIRKNEPLPHGAEPPPNEPAWPILTNPDPEMTGRVMAKLSARVRDLEAALTAEMGRRPPIAAEHFAPPTISWTQMKPLAAGPMSMDKKTIIYDIARRLYANSFTIETALDAAEIFYEAFVKRFPEES